MTNGVLLDSDKYWCPQDQPWNADGGQEAGQKESLEQLAEKHLSWWFALLDAVILEMIEIQLILVIL